MANGILSLQEKMVRIREKIPPLVKQAYSEEVNYDFIKIDDIFRHLTPAMNQQGVNFDIVSETATKKDERGNPMFVEYIPLYQMWIYEADLALRWTNAEDPEDRLEMTAHAIGFHQMPEKAKGSGWTYCLKYYLLNKFCINQGGDDPDMRNVAPPSDRNLEEVEGFAEDGWIYGKEDEYSQENSAGEAIFLETEGSTRETKESVKDKEAFGEGSGRGNIDHQEGQELTEDSPISPQNGTMVTLPESAAETSACQPEDTEELQNGMTVEEAGNVICNCGLYRGKTLGEIARSGPEGMQNLRWFVNSYRGRNEDLRTGARILLKAAKAA